MINVLNSSEVVRVSAGVWVCDSVYKGQKFLKAVLHTGSYDTFGTCHYGPKEGVTYYSAPKNLVGIVQKPINFWGYKGELLGGYTKYECEKSNASKCVFI